MWSSWKLEVGFLHRVIHWEAQSHWCTWAAPFDHADATVAGLQLPEAPQSRKLELCKSFANCLVTMKNNEALDATSLAQTSNIIFVINYTPYQHITPYICYWPSQPSSTIKGLHFQHCFVSRITTVSAWKASCNLWSSACCRSHSAPLAAKARCKSDTCTS